MFPSHSVLLSKWLPPSERGIGMAYGEIAMSIASMIVPLVVTYIADKYKYEKVQHTTSSSVITNTITSSTSSTNIIPGWRNGFYFVGLGCFSYLFIWIIFGRNEPNVCSYISKNELNYLNSVKKSTSTSTSTTASKKSSTKQKQKQNKKKNTDSSSSSSAGPSSSNSSAVSILFHPSIISLFLVHMIYNFVTLSINSWMPTYYNDVLGMQPSQSKIHIILPQICSLVVKLLVSKFALWVRQQKQNKLMTNNNNSNNKNNIDEEQQRSTILLFSRRLMSYIGFIVTAIPLWLLPIVANNVSSLASTATATNPRSYSPWYTTILFCISLMGTGFHSESFRANYLDVTTDNVGLISGIGNCLSSVSAMIAPFIVGKIIKKYGIGDGNNGVAGWSVVWKLSSILCIVAAFIFGSFSTTIPIEQQQQQKKEE